MLFPNRAVQEYKNQSDSLAGYLLGISFVASMLITNEFIKAQTERKKLCLINIESILLILLPAILSRSLLDDKPDLVIGFILSNLGAVGIIVYQYINSKLKKLSKKE